MASETTKGEIIHPINVVGTTKNAKFHVIDGDIRYNALLRRLWIRCMIAVSSTLHQMMKFPTKDGIKTIYGEQHAEKEMFVVHDIAPAQVPPPPKEAKDMQTIK
ncbi:uncharacterized protein [Nicotiana sylvestris]|uniref:uncharacterized protein n=1 Tax=Nicotiana sylvestris TaxID=4096 RepID=UPI00388C916F